MTEPNAEEVADFLDVVGIPAQIASGGNRVRINCQFCTKRGKQEDSKQHLYISLHQDFFMCYRCGKKGKYRDIERVYNITLPFKQGLSVPQTLPEPTRFYDPEIIALPPHQSVFENDMFSQSAHKYLNDRGIDDVTIKKYSISLVTEGDEKGRILIPLLYKGKPIAYQTRQFFFDGIKYLTSGERGIFNLDCGYASVVLVEGPFDAIRVGDYAVCGMGTNLSGKQMELLSMFFKEITILYDSDISGYQLVDLGERLVQKGLEVYIARLQEGDPSSCSDNYLSSALLNTISLRDTENITKMLIGV